MTDPTMNDAEEEALFARLKRGLELVRRDASLAPPEGAVTAAGADPETTAVLARLEASLRTLAANVEELARRADDVDAVLETRVESTVARTTAGLRAEIERLSLAIATLSTRPEAARPEAARVVPGTRPVPERVSTIPLPPRRFGVARAFLTAIVVLVLIGLGVTAATRLGYGPDKLPIGRHLQERFSAWRGAWLPQQAASLPEQARNTTASPMSDPPAKPSLTAGASAAPAPPATVAMITPGAAAAPPASPSPAAAAPPPSPPPAAAVSPTASPPPTLAQSAASAAAASADGGPGSPSTASASDSGQAPSLARSAEKEAKDAAPTAPAATPRAESRADVTLRAKGPVWVEVRERKGRILLRRTLQAGETWSAPSDSEADLLLSAGNVRNLELSVNGTPQPLPSAKGGVLRDARIENGA